MDLFDVLKHLHIACAFLSISGFTLRGYWMLSDSPALVKPLTRVLPHALDTLLLGSAIGMLLVWQVNPLALPWLSAKLIALLCYIGFGTVAFRFGRSKRARAISFALALLTAAYIVTVAYTKSPLGPLAG